MTETEKRNIPIVILTPGGTVAPGYTATSLADAAPHEPDGVYTMGRTFGRVNALLFDAHLDRLEDSARREGVTVALDRPAIRRALRALIDSCDHTESRFRLTIPRHMPEQLYVSIEPFTPPAPEVYENGVRVVTIEQLARHNPAAKTTAWMAERKSTVAAFPEGVYEGILVGPEGELLEGTSSNFYAVKHDVVYTAGEGVLGGMAQKAVLAVAEELGITIRREPALKNELWALEEAFLTSASRGVVPIAVVNTQIIADGLPGPLTTRLRLAYENWVNRHIEALA